MTTEQKAKAYDEALKRAEAAIDIAADKDLVKGVAITIFPELKESDDERIKKAILSALRGGIDTEKYLEKHGTNYGEVETWLEKQKEPDRIWTEEDDAKVKVMCKEGDLKPSEIAWLKELKNRIVKKEQEPVEWSEKDESYLQTVISEMKASKKAALGYEHKTYDAIILWLKSLRPQSREEIYQ